MNWLLNNYTWLISILVSLVSVILLALFKKKPLANVFSDLTSFLLSKIPEWINMAETKELYGKDKKLYVMELVNEFLKSHIDDKDETWINERLKFFDSFIELVLSTPRKKKGDNVDG